MKRKTVTTKTIQTPVKTYLDLETFSKVDLKTSGSYKYAEDCEILICVVKGTNTEPKVLSKLPTKTTLCVYNANFESPVINDPTIIYRDVQHKVAAMGLPNSLEKAGQALGLAQDVIKSQEGKRLIKKFSVLQKPKKKRRMNRNIDRVQPLGLLPASQYKNTRNKEKVEEIIRYTKENSPADWRLFVDYCKQDVIATQAIDEALPDLSKSEQALADLDLKINTAGIPIDVALVKRIVSLINTFTEKQIQLCKDLTGGFSPTQRKNIIEWCNERGTLLPDYKAESIKYSLSDPYISPEVTQVLQCRQNTSNSSLMKYTKMLNTVSNDGRIRGTLKFYGANTGRWAGRGIQPQNLPRGSINPERVITAIQEDAGIYELSAMFGSLPEALKSCIRGMIHHKDGFTVVDYSGIEARVVQWLVNDRKALKIFKDGKDVYKHMASLIFNIPYKKITKDQRFLGKQAILGLSYRMGTNRFIETCAGYGVTVNKETADRTVKKYRTIHHKLIRNWHRIETAAINAVRTKQIIEVGLIKFELRGDFLHMRLPSDREIVYPSPKIELVTMSWSKKKRQLTYMSDKGIRTSTHGGKLVENAVQGIARDILADALKKLDAKGYKIIFHVHDEVIIEGTFPPEDIIEIMCDLEPWAYGNIIDAEGFNCSRYKKD